MVDVAGRLLAIQAQDQMGFRLTIRARTRNLTAADVDRAFTEERSVVVTWANRGALHLHQEGIAAPEVDRGVDVIVRAVTAEGPRTRAQLQKKLDADAADVMRFLAAGRSA